MANISRMAKLTDLKSINECDNTHVWESWKKQMEPYRFIVPKALIPLMRESTMKFSPFITISIYLKDE
jgi:hypothetical protein